MVRRRRELNIAENFLDVHVAAGNGDRISTAEVESALVSNHDLSKPQLSAHPMQ